MDFAVQLLLQPAPLAERAFALGENLPVPELPEVEHLRRTLEPWLLGATIEAVTTGLHDVVDRSFGAANVSVDEALLVGGRVTELLRRGKNLAICAADGRVLGVHLGMSGRMTVGVDLPASDRHCHARWRLRCRDRRGAELLFRDPRRFGGLAVFPSPQRLADSWTDLGPDAFLATAAELEDALRGRRRQAKAALLDQTLLAGVGNIYADEALFRAGVHPAQPLDRLPDERLAQLVHEVQSVLSAAVHAGGSTLRDYVDADAQTGRFQNLHIVYGKAGLPCPHCHCDLKGTTVAGRTTVFCSRCQRLIHKPRRRGR